MILMSLAGPCSVTLQAPSGSVRLLSASLHDRWRREKGREKMKTSCGSIERGMTALILVAALSGGVRADFMFGEARNLGPAVNSPSSDGSPDISADGLTLHFDSRRPAGQGDWDLWVATRAPGGDWTVPIPLPSPINSSSADAGPSMSADGLSLYFASDRPGGYGSFDLWVTTRKTKDDPWEPPVNLGPTVNSADYDNHPSISPDGLSLYFDSARPDGADYDIWVTTRKTTQAPWRTPVNLGPVVNSTTIELSPSIWSDGLTLFFDTRVPDRDIWVAFRETLRGPWETAEPFGGEPVNTWYFDSDPMLSADGSMLYFASDRPGGSGQDLWQIPILPVVDLNGDGVVDFKDFSMFARSWRQYESAADIAPAPFGDWAVDAFDAAVLAQNWLTDFRLLAHWRLDESAGDAARDRVGGHNGTLHGSPMWQPKAGKIGGALLLDGVDDYVAADFVRDPAEGPLSIFAWVKGGSPGQVIVSQADGADWLVAAAANGNLRTDLKSAGRLGRPLASQAVVTDGAWHRVGLVWDGKNRILYVDDVEVARDTQPDLKSMSTSLQIGCGSSRKPGTFWSGLIDDVRLYKQAVSP
jgi:Tol biopolymer transport system component